MRFLIIGLGSMGKRRVRCLHALGYTALAGFDIRPDRREEVVKKYGIPTYGDVTRAIDEFRPDALIISVPPDIHHQYVKIAIERKLHFFVEASVVDTDMDWIKEKLSTMDVVAAPSSTMTFHPAILQISDIVKSGELGTLSNVIFHSGQYLPDWHTYEKVSDYYVSNPATGGAREIVPFELTWFVHLLGFPQRVCGNVRKTIRIVGAENIDDTYNFLLDYDRFQASVTVDVVSRYATRRLLINGEDKQLIWDWNQKNIRIYEPASSQWETHEYQMMGAESGYNANIGENMYIDELRSFIRAITDNVPFINTMENDHRVLKLLYAIEASSRTQQFVEFTI